MEIVSERRLGSYGPCDVSNEVKAATTALRFRVKSGWAAAVFVASLLGHNLQNAAIKM